MCVINISQQFINVPIVYHYGGLQSMNIHGGTPSHHPFLLGDFRIVYENDEKHRIGFVLFFCVGFWVWFWLSFLVPCALYLQQNQNLSFRMVFATFWYGHSAFGMELLHVAMVAFHFAWYLPEFCMSTSHLHGICYILVLQTFMWVC